MISTLDRTNLQVLRAEIDQAVAQVAAKHGLKISLGRGKFSEQNASFNLEIATQQDGIVVTKAASSFKLYADMYGFQADDLGKTFISGGRQFKITGLNTRSPKFPVQALCLADNKSYKFQADSVKLALKRS